MAAWKLPPAAAGNSVERAATPTGQPQACQHAAPDCARQACQARSQLASSQRRRPEGQPVEPASRLPVHYCTPTVRRFLPTNPILRDMGEPVFLVFWWS